MVELPYKKKDKNGILVVKDSQIEAFAYRQLLDFDAHYFDRPHPLEVERLVEFYLGKDIRYYTLSPDHSIFGVTALTGGDISIIGPKGKPERRRLKKGDICIDFGAHYSSSAAFFTILHEAWHSQFDTIEEANSGKTENLAYESASTLSGQSFENVAPSENTWMEHHANRYAASMMMPKPFVESVWKTSQNAFVNSDKLESENVNNIWRMICNAARELNVSQSAMALRVKELSLISNEVFNSLHIKKGMR